MCLRSLIRFRLGMLSRFVIILSRCVVLRELVRLGRGKV